MLSLTTPDDPKKVGYIELVYDLVFVYLVSKNVEVLHSTENGFFTPMVFFTYIASSLIILQIWCYSCLLINRYLGDSLRQHLMIYVNMYLLCHMGEGIRADWGSSYARYHLAWAFILIHLGMQYALELLRCVEAKEMAPLEEAESLRLQAKQITGHILVLFASASIIIISIPVYQRTGQAYGPWAMILSFAFLFLNRKNDARVPVDFPHLAERLMLFILFTFGNMLLEVITFFTGEINGASLYFSLMAFLLIAGLLSCYGYFYEHLLNMDCVTSGTGYIALHLVMILAQGNMIAAIDMMNNDGISSAKAVAFLLSSLLAFFGCLLMTKRYAKTAVFLGARFYAVLIGFSACFLLLMASFYQNGGISLAFTVLFVYVQLLLLVLIPKQQKRKEGNPFEK